MSDTTQSSSFDHWGVVEIFGHDQYAGRIMEQVIAGKGFVRIDVPEGDGRAAFSKVFGADAIFSIEPTSEEVARAIARRLGKIPLSVPEARSIAEPRRIPTWVDQEHDDEECPEYYG